MLGHKSADSPNKLNTFYYFFCMPFNNAEKSRRETVNGLIAESKLITIGPQCRREQRFLLINYLNGK